MVPLDYSRHAQERLILRRVTKRQVIATIAKPDSVYEDAASSALVAVKRTRNRYLVVVYAISKEGTNRVITLYNASDVDRLIRRKL